MCSDVGVKDVGELYLLSFFKTIKSLKSTLSDATGKHIKLWEEITSKKHLDNRHVVWTYITIARPRNKHPYKPISYRKTLAYRYVHFYAISYEVGPVLNVFLYQRAWNSHDQDLEWF